MLLLDVPLTNSLESKGLSAWRSVRITVMSLFFTRLHEGNVLSIFEQVPTQAEHDKRLNFMRKDGFIFRITFK